MNNDCPNILPIKTPLQDYIYDVNLNTFVPVPQDVFQYAEKRLKNKNGTIEEKRKFDAMMEKGYFSSEHIKRINNPYSNYLPLLLSRNMSQILLQVTQGCNFRCEYCIYTASIDGIQRKHTNKRMDFHTAKHAVDYLWNHSIDSDVVTIGFYGGEPLLEFELIKQVILYTEKKFQGKIVHYAMTTNVSLLSIATGGKQAFCTQLAGRLVGRSVLPHGRNRNCSQYSPHPGGSSAFSGCQTAFWCWQTQGTATFPAGWAGRSRSI